MAKATTQFGRPSIFRNKAGGKKIQGLITKTGTAEFERARKRLAHLAARSVAHTSDADVIEFLARGEAATVAYLEQHA